MAPFAVGRNVNSVFIGWSVLSVPVRSNQFKVLYRSSIPLQITSTYSIKYRKKSVKTPNCNSGFIYLSLTFCQILTSIL